ncbi:hypothetical protein WMY93_016526 [Mugilogobius chulae]|uniref:Uncharacterized protein n=1 Tax=Mugilogobius chulae TaxID=88201 RepID=A0AAW0NXT8_9GOBI
MLRNALRDILHMVSAQWEQLQRQIRRQHGWMVRALRCIQSRLFYQFHQSHETVSVSAASSANQKTAATSEGLKLLQRATLAPLFIISAHTPGFDPPNSRKSPPKQQTEQHRTKGPAGADNGGVDTERKREKEKEGIEVLKRIAPNEVIG